MTHGLVDPPEVSKKTPADSIIRQMLHKAKERLVRYLPARVRDDEWFIRARGRLQMLASTLSEGRCSLLSLTVEYVYSLFFSIWTHSLC